MQANDKKEGFFEYIKRLVRFVLRYPPLLINIGVGVLLLVCAYSPHISPLRHPYWSCLGLVFPLLALGNGVFCVYWALVRRKVLFLPVLFFLFVWTPLRSYIPFNRPIQAQEGDETISLLTYNTMNLFTEKREKGKSIFPSLEYIKESDADIVCVQEFPLYLKEQFKAMRGQYPHQAMLTLSGGNGLVCFSKFPILSHEKMDYPSESNGSMVLRIRYKNDTILVINNHLESNRINDKDKTAYNDLIEKPSKDNLLSKGRTLLRKLGKAVSIRSVQADSIARYVARHKRPLTIVCGDFNDSPVSYTHRVAGEGLTDAYMERGNGVGFTYNKSRMYFRIDHIFVNDGFEVLQCTVDKSISSSDHYPMKALLRVR